MVHLREVENIETRLEGFAFVEQSGERFLLPELHRLDGELAPKRPEPDRARAEACLLQAVDIARSLAARRTRSPLYR
jgi:hypothetical protein